MLLIWFTYSSMFSSEKLIRMLINSFEDRMSMENDGSGGTLEWNGRFTEADFTVDAWAQTHFHGIY